MEVSKRKGGVLQKMLSSVLFSVSSVCPTAIVYLPVYFSINCDMVSKSINSHAAQKNGYEIIEGEYSPGQKLIKPIAVWVYLLLAFCPKIVYNQINILAVINLSVSVNY